MNHPGHVEVTLPHGLWQGGAHLRRLTLRPLAGSDEEALLQAAGELPAARVSLLLGRCLVALEGRPVDSADVARRLTTGDREALLLHLRRLAFGDRLDCVLECPRPACGEKMDLTLSIGDLLLAPYAEPRPDHEAAIETGGRPYTVRFRLPSGADQESAARRWQEAGPRAALELLAERCILEVTRPEGPAGAGDVLSDAAEALSAAIADADPQAELLLRLDCPECGEAFSSRFDTASFLFAELAAPRDSLYRQVHALARHYHWSEREILSLTSRKRRLYLGLIAGDRDAVDLGRAGAAA